MKGNVEQIETVIIGGGHAGLTMSYYLSQLGREHLILERGQWRSDGVANAGIPFALQFPNWTIEVRGYKYQCDNPENFAPGREIV